MQKFYIKLFLLIIIGFSFSSEIYAQKRCRPTKNKKAVPLYEQALNMKDFNLAESTRLLERAVLIEPDFYEAAFELGYIYYNKIVDAEKKFMRQGISKYYTKAEKYFNISLDECKSFSNYLVLFYLGELNYLKRDYKKSKEYFMQYINATELDEKYDKHVNKRLTHIEDYFYLIKNPVDFDPQILENISTEADEFLPLVSPDGLLIFYTRRSKKNAEALLPDDYIEELMISHRLTPLDSVFEVYSEGQPMPKPFNDGRLQGGATITIDNKELYITICDYERTNYTSVRNCDIYFSTFDENKWTALRKLGTHINGLQTFEGQPSITSLGDILYFSSNRDGGFGGYDIYKVVKDSVTRMWGHPINLGPVINTEGDEKTPFIHSDNQTLYYSSNGLGGMGGFDIFISRKTEDAKWQKPQNIGYPINTVGDEVAYTVSANGKKIYFSSMSFDGVGGWDIYTADLTQDMRPKKIVFIKGKITDNEGKIVTDAKVELTNLETFESTEGFVDNKTGKYAVTSTVRKDEEFMMTIKKKGYFYDTWKIDTKDKRFDPPTKRDVKIDKIEKGKTITLNNVNFATNSAELTNKSVAYLNELVEFLNVNPTMRIEIRGHTDNIGNEDDNINLSYARAKSVRNFLIEKDINRKRLTFKAFGESKPITTNNTKEGRAINRRVEFFVIEK